MTRSLSRVPWRKSGHANRDPAWRSLFLCDHDRVAGDADAHPVHCVIEPVLMAQWRVEVHLRAIDLDGGGSVVLLDLDLVQTKVGRQVDATEAGDAILADDNGGRLGVAHSVRCAVGTAPNRDDVAVADDGVATNRAGYDVTVACH